MVPCRPSKVAGPTLATSARPSTRRACQAPRSTRRRRRRAGHPMQIRCSQARSSLEWHRHMPRPTFRGPPPGSSSRRRPGRTRPEPDAESQVNRRPRHPTTSRHHPSCSRRARCRSRQCHSRRRPASMGRRRHHLRSQPSRLRPADQRPPHLLHSVLLGSQPARHPSRLRRHNRPAASHRARMVGGGASRSGGASTSTYSRTSRKWSRPGRRRRLHRPAGPRR